MCDEGYDDTVSVWHETVRTARKEHTCRGCRETILPRNQYRVTNIVFDGTAWSRKHCLRCARVIDKLRVRMDEYTTEILDLNCGEVWEDAPADVAALAFWIPADEQQEQGAIAA